MNSIYISEIYTKISNKIYNKGIPYVIKVIPCDIDQYYYVISITVVYTPVSILPAELFNLDLKELELCDNKLIIIPKEIENLSSLIKLDISSNRLTALPREISNLSYLIKLNISSNRLTALPREISNLSYLIKLNISSNRLTALPREIFNLKKISDYSISLNNNLYKNTNGLLSDLLETLKNSGYIN